MQRPADESTDAPAKPTLAVVIPCFNCEAQIERCVQAIAQSAGACPELREILLVDGGSSDGTSAICAALAAEHDLVFVLKHDITSASGKRNAAVRHTDAAYVLFTDPDCVCTAGWLPSMAEAARAGIRCATGRVTGTGGPLQTSVRARAEDKVFRPGILYRALPFKAGSSNNLMIERALLQDLGGFPEDVGPGTPNGVAEDTEVLYLALLRGIPVHFIAGAHVVHEHSESLDDFLLRKENYARGLFYFQVRRYRSDPAVWLGVVLGFAYSIACLVGYSLLFRRIRVRQALAELRGRGSGIRLALSTKTPRQ